MHKNIPKNLIIKLLPVLIPALLLSGCGSARSSEAPVLLEPAGGSFRSVKVVRDTFSRTEIYEGIVSPDVTELSFDRNGTVRKISVPTGTYVHENDLLITLDTEEEEKKVDELLAAQEELQRSLSYQKAKHDNRVAYKNIELAQIAEAAGTDSPDYALKALEISEMNLSYEETVRSVQSEIDRKEEELQALREKIAAGTLSAPHDGYFYLPSEITEGVYVRTDAPVAEITIDDTLLFLTEYIDDSTLRKSALSVFLNGTYYAVDYLPLSESEQYRMIFSSEKKNSVFLFRESTEKAPEAGQSAYLFVESNVIEDAVQVPINAVYSDSEGSYVYLIGENQTKQKCYVTTGLSNGIMTVIKEGLSGGETVYVN